MKKTGRHLMMIAALVFLFSFSISAPVFTAQRMNSATRLKTAKPTAPKDLTKRAKKVQIRPPKSFLIIQAFQIRIVPCHVGDTLTFHAVVINNGPKAIKNVKIGIYMNNYIAGSVKHDLNSKEKKVFQVIVKPKKAGTYTAKAVVDPDGTIDKKFYRGNTASKSIAVFARMQKKAPGIVTNRSKITSAEMKKRAPFPHSHGSVPPGMARPTSIKKPTGQTVPLIQGKILKVTAKVQGPFRSLSGVPRGQKSYGLDIRWACKGVVPNRVDILLYPYRQIQKKITLVRGGSNSGHYTKTLTGINEKQKYIVRVQSHNGRMYQDSNAFYFKYATVAGAVMTQRKITRETGRVAASQLEITGHINSGRDGHVIHGRRIKILLKQGRQTIFSQIKTLDNSGACDYGFLPRVLGTYTITVEKVASPASSSGDIVNACFDGTTPASRTVTLTRASHDITVGDFTINFYIAWDYPHLCW